MSIKGLFDLPEVKTVAVALLCSAGVSLVSAYAASRGNEALVIERLTSHDTRIAYLEDVTRSIAATQASQAASASSVAATQQGMARIQERTDADIREMRTQMGRHK